MEADLDFQCNLCNSDCWLYNRLFTAGVFIATRSQIDNCLHCIVIFKRSEKY